MKRGGSHHARPMLGRPLTPRQMDCVKARVRHGSRKESAVALGIAETTVRAHITEALERVGASNLEGVVYVLWLRDLWGEA